MNILPSLYKIRYQDRYWSPPVVRGEEPENAMIQKIGDININILDDTDLVVICKEVTFYIVAMDIRVTILPGFKTDGASIPRFFWRILGHPMNGCIFRRALLHDALYQIEAFTGEDFSLNDSEKRERARAKCDHIFLDYMEQELPISLWKRWSIYKGVRIGGSYVWKNHTDEYVRASRQLVFIS